MINIRVLNTDFEIIGVVDTYESFIWTDRWNTYGDFELYTSFDYNLLQLCQQDYYIQIDDSEHTMIIEGVQVETDSETGIHLRITGRSLESILDRRIVWKQTTVNANTKFETAIKNIIDKSFGTSGVAPDPGANKVANKKISDARKMTGNPKGGNLIFHSLDPNDPDEEDAYNYISGILVEKTQYTGDNVYDILLKMCDDQNNTIGWKITMDDNHNFVFRLRTGKDRSYQQTGYMRTADAKLYANKQYYTYNSETNQYVPVPVSGSDRSKAKNTTYYVADPIRPFVIFSPNFDNIVNTDYLDTIEGMKNVTLVAGQDQGQNRKTITVGSASHLSRRELFTDARDLRMEDYGGDASRYNEALKLRGYNNLVENSRIQSYEGQVEATRQFVFGEDFFMGDIVQMSNEYGINGAVRVIEWVMSESSGGFEVYPTFDAVQIIDDSEYEEEDDDA